MGKKTNPSTQEGIVNFLPLVIIAVLLIGFVGYVSVKRLNPNSKSVVLGDSVSNSGSENTKPTATNADSNQNNKLNAAVTVGTGDDNKSPEASPEGDNNEDLQGTELDNEAKGLEDVGNLDIGIPGLNDNLDLENSITSKGIVGKIDSTEVLEASGAGTPKTLRVRGTRNLKFLGILPVNAPVTVDVDSTTGEQLNIVDQPFYLKYLDFLFTK